MGSRCSRAAACSRAVCRSPRARWWSCSGIQHHQQRGRPQRPLLAVLGQGVNVLHLMEWQVLGAAVCSRAVCRSMCARWWSCCGGTASAVARVASAASPRRAWSRDSVCCTRRRSRFSKAAVCRVQHTAGSMMGGARAMGLQLRPAAMGALAASPRCTRPKGLAHAALGGAAWFSDSGDCTISCCS